MLAMMLNLTACGKSQSPSEPYLEPFSETTLAALVEAGSFSEELEELDADMAFALYRLADCGLEREDLKDAVVLRSAGATCEEAAVLILGITVTRAICLAKYRKKIKEEDAIL